MLFRLKRQLNRLDELKGIAMLMVIFTHNSWSDENRLTLGFPFWIDMAVPIFIMISGYLNAKSMDKKKQDSFREAYEITGIITKIIRFYLPYLFSCAVILIADITNSDGYGPNEYFDVLFKGKTKFGGYYTFMMLQFIFIFPLIYKCIKRNPKRGLLEILLINIAYEIIKEPMGITSDFYRVCVFRLLFAIALGAFIALYDKEIPMHILWAGFVIMGLTNYILVYQEVELFGIDKWVSKSWPGAIYVFPLVYYLIRRGPTRPCLFKPVALIGAKSYHVFLAQMVYYCSFRRFVYPLIKSIVHARWSVLTVKFVINVGICVPLGLLFALAAEPIEAWIINNVKRLIGVKNVTSKKL